MSVLHAKNLYKSYLYPTKVDVLRGVSLTLEPGETVAIMGKSGEGKSTLLHILGTLEDPTQGELTLCGQSMSALSKESFRQKHLGFIFQTYNLLDEYTTLENVLMPARIARLDISKGSPAYLRASLLIKQVGLEERTHFLTKLLSGGEKQRASIARALCNDPDLILADEPSGNLDHTHSTLLHDLLIRLAKESNKALLIATHDPELAQRCDRILILKDGELICTS